MSHAYNTSRRGMLAAMAVAPVVIAAPSVAHAAPRTGGYEAIEAEYIAARDALNVTSEADGSPTERAYLAAWRRLSYTDAETPAQFARQFWHLCSDGCPTNEDVLERMAANAKSFGGIR